MNRAYLICCFLLLSAPILIFGQDTIQSKDIAPYSYTFTIKNGEMQGEGASVLNAAISESHVVMLGNNSRSKEEADLDYSVLQQLDRNEFKTIILEIGTASGEVLNRQVRKPTSSIDHIKRLNQKYGWLKEDKLYAPIPELKNIAAGKLVKYASENDWSFLAMGTESWTSFKMLTDELYCNVSKSNQENHKQLYQKSIDLIDSLYSTVSGQNYSDILNLTSALKSSIVYIDFLQEMSEYPKNQTIVESIRTSIDYWWMYGNREFYQKNEWNSQHNKTQVKRALEAKDFNFSTDKLFVKMWRGHLSKAVTPNGFYGIGNMLSSLSDYHGNKSLCIAVFRRYYTKENKVIDLLESNGNNRNKIFLNLGKEDEWTLIDLRPFNKTFY